MYRIYMTLFQFDGWHVQFLEDDRKSKLRLKLRFQTPQEILAFIARTPTERHLAFRKGFDRAIAEGRGGVFLDISEEQYRKLK